MKAKTTRLFTIVVLFLYISGLLTIAFHQMIKPWDVEAIHQDNLEGNVAYPGKYRILVPILIESAHNFVEKHNLSLPKIDPIVTGEIDIKIMYDLFYLVIIFLNLMCCFVLLQKWLPEIYAFAGTLYLGILHILAFLLFKPDDVMGIFFFLLFTILLVSKRKWYFDLLMVLIVFISTFNKESSLFLLCNYGLFRLHAFWYAKKRTLKKFWEEFWCVPLMALGFIAPYIYLRLILGTGPYVIPLLKNSFISHMIQLLNFFFLFNITIFVALWKIKKRPTPLKLLAWGLVPYALGHLATAHIGEMRVWLPVMPIVLLLFFVSLQKLHAMKPQDSIFKQ